MCCLPTATESSARGRGVILHGDTDGARCANIAGRIKGLGKERCRSVEVGPGVPGERSRGSGECPRHNAVQVVFDPADTDIVCCSDRNRDDSGNHAKRIGRCESNARRRAVVLDRHADRAGCPRVAYRVKCFRHQRRRPVCMRPRVPREDGRRRRRIADHRAVQVILDPADSHVVRRSNRHRNHSGNRAVRGRRLDSHRRGRGVVLHRHADRLDVPALPAASNAFATSEAVPFACVRVSHVKTAGEVAELPTRAPSR